MRETSFFLFLTLIKHMLLKYLTLPQDNLDDLLNIDNRYFAQMVSQIYPTELQLKKGNPSDTGPLFGPRLVHYKGHSFNQNL